MLCKYKGCKEKATTWFEKKRYCRKHFYMKRDEGKFKRRNQEQKINKWLICCVDGCYNKLCYRNKSGLCIKHLKLSRMGRKMGRPKKLPRIA